MKIVIVGTGYVGLITGLCFSSKGHSVTCIEINSEIIEKLNNSIPTFYEEGLEELLAEELSSGRFKVQSDLTRAIIDAEIVKLTI